MTLMQRKLKYACILIAATAENNIRVSVFIKWASTREKTDFCVSDQQSRRPACAFAQSGQRLCHSLFLKDICSMQNFSFLTTLCS